jgi:hypothetical protein
MSHPYQVVELTALVQMFQHGACKVDRCLATAGRVVKNLELGDAVRGCAFVVLGKRRMRPGANGPQGTAWKGQLTSP